MVDQSPNIQQHMSKQRSITSDLSTLTVNGSYLWDNPREVGSPYTDKNNETIYAGPLLGFQFFSSLTEIRDREFVKGGSVVFTFRFDDLTPLVNGSELPCRGMPAPKVSRPPQPVKTSPCLRPSPAPTHPPPMTTDWSIFGAAPVSVISPLLLLIPPLMLLTP